MEFVALEATFVSSKSHFAAWTFVSHRLETVHTEGDAGAGPEAEQAAGAAQDPGHGAGLLLPHCPLLPRILPGHSWGARLASAELDRFPSE